MKFWIKTIFGIASIVTTFQASAGFYAAEDLYRLFEAQGPAQSRTASYYQAYGYTIGVYDQSDETLWCAPAGTKAIQVLKVAENYLLAHPEGWQRSAASEIGKSFVAAWPCQ